MPLRKKVAIVITRMDLGGAQEVALETAKRLDPRLFEVTLLAGPQGMLDSKAEAALGSRYVRLPQLRHPIAPWDDLAVFFSLVRFFYKEKIDLVHTHSSKAGLIGRAAAFVAGVPKVLHTVHGWSFHDLMPNPMRWIFIQIERLLAHVTDALAVVALSCRDKGLMNSIGEPSQYALLRAGVDLKAWKAVAKTPGAGAELGDVVVGCIANCKPQKNPLDFVRVAALTLKQAPEARFIYGGDGPLLEEAVALAKALGVEARVHFLGWVEDPRALAAGFDLFLLTSLWEGLPCVFPQALALGLPVVATNVDGAPEIIREGHNGYLCQPGDVEALAERVVALVKQPGLRARLSLAARQSVGDEFGFEDMAGKTTALYQRLCGS
jgi:glycosyltransferase involved in cell wall biosynthesis